MIVGARVAGSVLASVLGRSGVRVLLVDSSHFPSDTLSTHFFRGAGALESFRRASALEAVLGIGAPRLTREYHFAGDRTEPEVTAPQDPGTVGFSLSVRRIELDATLARTAGQVPGVTLLERTRATRLLREGSRVVGVELRTGDRTRTVRCRYVVGADGRRSWVAQETAAPLYHFEAGHRGMYYAYFEEFTNPDGGRGGAEFSVNGDEMAYVFPSDHDLTCVALSLNAEAFAWCRADPQTRFEQRLARHPGLHRRVPRNRRVGRVQGIGPTPNFIRVPAGPGWALVGDAEMHQDPFTGRGIDNASGHAVRLASALAGLLRGSIAEAEAWVTYERERDAMSAASYYETVRVSRDLTAS